MGLNGNCEIVTILFLSGVEQQQLATLIKWRSGVQFPPPLPPECRPRGAKLV